MDEQDFGVLERLKDITAELEAKKRRLAGAETLHKNNKTKLGDLGVRLRKEQKDVEMLDKTSLSNFFKKLTNSMDEKYAKEQREYIEAKVLYDEYIFTVEQSEREIAVLKSEIRKLENEYQDTLGEARRDSAGLDEYFNEKENAADSIRSIIKELTEAIQAGERAISLIDQATKELGDAKSWATYDMFSRGGIFSHMAKYQHIDNAEKIVNAVAYALEKFRKELGDVGGIISDFNVKFGQSTRLVDFFFDNIFTDYNVRSKITGSIDNLGKIRDKVYAKVNELRGTKGEYEYKLKSIINL